MLVSFKTSRDKALSPQHEQCSKYLLSKITNENYKSKPNPNLSLSLIISDESLIS